MQRLLTIPLLICLIVGCNDYNTPDVHRDVFKTPEQMALAHRAENQKAWQELAVSMVKSDRPDISAKEATGSFGVILSGDGIEQAVDLTPVEDELIHHSDREQQTLRTKLTDEYRHFDTQRFRALGFDSVRSRIYPQLVNGAQLADMETQTAHPGPPGETATIHSTPVVVNLFWVPVVRNDAGETLLPIDRELIQTWKTTPAAVDDAAITNLRARLKQYTTPIDTISLSSLGQSGSLKNGLGAEVILLSDFLDAVRADWKTQDDLVLFVPTRTSALVAERHNDKLLEKLLPEWKKLLPSASDPLCDQFLLRSSEGLSFFSYTPATQPSAIPATTPATTKPQVYIVH